MRQRTSWPKMRQKTGECARHHSCWTTSAKEKNLLILLLIDKVRTMPTYRPRKTLSIPTTRFNPLQLPSKPALPLQGHKTFLSQWINQLGLLPLALFSFYFFSRKMAHAGASINAAPLVADEAAFALMPILRVRFTSQISFRCLPGT